MPDHVVGAVPCRTGRGDAGMNHDETNGPPSLPPSTPDQSFLPPSRVWRVRPNKEKRLRVRLLALHCRAAVLCVLIKPLY